MKKLLLFSITIIAFYSSLIETALAAPTKAKIYCKYTSQGVMSIYDVETEEGHFACQEPLKLGAACYIGTRKAAIRFINSGLINWGDERIEKAHYRGAVGVSYKYVDSIDNTEASLIIDECLPHYFEIPQVGPFVSHK